LRTGNLLQIQHQHLPMDLQHPLCTRLRLKLSQTVLVPLGHPSPLPPSETNSAFMLQHGLRNTRRESKTDHRMDWTRRSRTLISPRSDLASTGLHRCGQTRRILGSPTKPRNGLQQRIPIYLTRLKETFLKLS
jgi:hypothetical protein